MHLDAEQLAAGATLDLEARVAALEERCDRAGDPDRLAMVVFSGDLDQLLSALVMATGAAACGMQVSMFFTFWGTAGLRRSRSQVPGKTWTERALGWLLPGGPGRQRLSRLNLGGLGRRLLEREMRRKNVPDLASLLEIASQTGVQLHVCEMSMSLLGIREEELLEYPGRKICGVASFLLEASRSGTTLFI